MKKLLILFCILPFSVYAQDGHDHSHGDHDHSHGTDAGKAEEVDMRRTTEATSERYEVLISYGPIHSGEPALLNLFVSDVETNAAMDSIEVNVVVPSMDNARMQLVRRQAGWYEFEVTFPVDAAYDFHVTINGPAGPALLNLTGVRVGDHIHEEEEHTHDHAWYSHGWVTFTAGVLFMLLVWAIMRRVRNKRMMVVLAVGILFTSQQAISPVSLVAHDGPHGPASVDSGVLSDEFEIPKETQFLFEVLTKRISHDSFSPARRLYGRVIAAPNGYAEVHTPQAARIVSVHAMVGQNVVKGDVLATVELVSDAASQTTLLAAMNDATAEYEAARKEVARLESIRDIAAGKQLDEAHARLNKATENKKLLEQGGVRSYALKAPIDGTLEPFTWTTGSVLSSEDVIFRISDARHVLIEAQLFEQDLDAVQHATRFQVQCADKTYSLDHVSLVSVGQRLSGFNQAPQALFSVENPDGDLRIGEMVSVFAFEETTSGHLFVPDESLDDMNGKPVIFVKVSAEKYRIRYVSAGRDNGMYTEILNGLAEGEKIVTSGTYQVKMIFMNQ